MTTKQIFTQNVGNNISAAVQTPVTLTPYVVASTDPLAGIQVVDAFINVDASLELILTNPSASGSTSVVVYQGVNLEGTSNDAGVATDTGIGNTTVTIPASSTVVFKIIDSSLFETPVTYVGLTSGTTYTIPGLYILPASSSYTYALQINPAVKYPQTYTGISNFS